MTIQRHRKNPLLNHILIMSRLSLRLLVIITLFIGFGQFTSAASKKISATPAALRAKAANYFKKEDYDKAVNAYRSYLKKVPKDYNTWNNLAASYYHSGLPARAARYLKYVEKKTTQKSYNAYYQGLAYYALNKKSVARKKFSYAARYTDEYAARSAYELAVMEYNNRSYDKANYWAGLYIQRYPTGPAVNVCRQIQQSVRSGSHIDGLSGNKKPDMEKALFRYSKYSLSPNPHYWFVQLGSSYVQGTAKSPFQDGTVKNAGFVDYALTANAGVGYGPVKKGDALAFGGYTYRQRWNTDVDRINTFIEDFDPTYFPFRGDLLERSHELYGDYRHKMTQNVFGGFFARKDFTFAGSDLIPGPDQPNDITASTLTKDTTLMIPWLGISYLDNYYTLFYLYMRKQINSITDEFSSKTYNLFGDDDLLMSYGLSHNMEFPQKKLRINLEVFQYEFVYNDYWLDYNRLGAIVSGEYEFYPNIYLRGLFGFYTDTYILDRLKQDVCKYLKRENLGGASAFPQTCPRVDDGQLFELTTYWNYSQFHRIEGTATMVSNKNASLIVYDKSKISLELRFTWAFPSAERVIRYVDRFADTAFTKEAE